MNKFYSVLLATAVVCTGVHAEVVKTPAKARAASRTENVRTSEFRKNTLENRKASTKNMLRKSVQKVVAGPSADDKIIDETPAGTLTDCVKNGSAYGYNWLIGLVYQNVYNGLTKTVISEDHTKVYVQNPIFFNYLSEENWIVGDLSGDVVSFTFPQLVDVDEYYDDYGNLEEAYYDYAISMEYVIEDEETGDGWFYPRQDQTYKFKLEEDGSLTSLMGEDIMIGVCSWIDGDDLEEGEEPYWSWIGNGDFITDIKPITETVAEVPDDVEFAEWQYLSDISSRPVQVGIKGDNMYIKGLYSNMKGATVTGTIQGDKVVFPSGQYLGPYVYGGTLTYFLGGEMEMEDGYKYFNIGENLTFSYDKTANVLQSEGAYCISCAPDKVLYYVMGDKPYICIPAENINVTKLITPILADFYDVDEEYDYDAEMYFDFPTIDAERQILSKDRLFYQVIMDDEVFTFYDDEYELPEGLSEMSDVPYGYETMETYDFSVYGAEHGFLFHTRGFESLGVRTLYKPAEGDIVYSAVLWAPGYEGSFSSGIKGIDSDRTRVSVEYYDLNGLRVNRPVKGVYVMRTTFNDGTTSVRKVIAK